MDDFIIKAGTPRGNQLFRIYKTAKRLDFTITVNARHIFYDNLNNLVENAEGSGLNADEAIKLIFAEASSPHRFSVNSTVSPDALRSVSFSDVNPAYAIFRTDTGEDMTKAGLIQLYGGELLRDNFNITLAPSIGMDRGFTVRYRKNLTGLSFTQTCEDIVTRIKPVGRVKGDEKKKEEDRPLYLPEAYVDSPNIGLYFMPKIETLDCPDAVVESGRMSFEEAYALMRESARKLFDDGADLPKINAKLDFVLLSQADNYREYMVLEEIYLGDVVSVIHEELGVRLKAKCFKYRYDCLLGKYEAIELGDFREQLSRSIERGAAGKAEAVSTALTIHMGDGSHLSAAEREWLTKAIEAYPV